MKKIILFGLIFSLTACMTSEKEVREIIRKNPKIVFDTIEENPGLFLEVLNRAANKARVEQQQKRMSEMQQQQEEQMKNPLKPVLDEKRRLMGSADAKVVIVEYADFQCPACRMAHENLKVIKAKHKDKVQVYFKHMPLNFHEMALPAAHYYEAIFMQDKDKARRFYNALFEKQSSLKNEAFLKKTAQSLGVNMKKLETDLKSEAVQNTVAADMKEFEAFGFTGTPVILINGVAFHGAQPVEVLEEAIGKF